VLNEVARFIVNPQVIQRAGSSEISGDLVIPPDQLDEAPSLVSLVGGPLFGGMSGTGELSDAHVTVALDTPTDYVSLISSEATLTLTLPPGNAQQAGAPPVSFPVPQKVKTTLSVTTVNDPSIRVGPPL
jgi:hypothetical protein